ncbi:MAG: signal recognition particle-docking protein FtsY [Clostridiales bacterium]|nr:signal recognition particle-docking protein FtsY [Clostridia bacterium]MCR4564099.1 signal recognition particle-docking protein FtsY [Clostridiales bacterium]
MGIFRKTNRGLSKTRKHIAGAIDDMLDNFDVLDENLYSELEEILVMGDVGVTTSVQIVELLKEKVEKEKLHSGSQIRNAIKEIVADLLVGGEDMGLLTVPSVILVIGVNGVGKTTTIGKLASMYKAQGKKVLLGAADTFRAAAIDQLQIWADRAGVELIKHGEGSDPAAVVFDTIAAGKARNSDIIIIDTAGRLHNKKNLMDELSKIYRVIDRELPYSDREVLLVLDATTGQNAVNQAREFKEVAEITGIVLTKLDGTARGGVVLAIKNELGLAVKFIGVGEQIDDLQPFNPRAFADGLFDKIEYKEGEDIEINYSDNGEEAGDDIKENNIEEDGQPSDEVKRENESSSDEIKEEEADIQTADDEPVSGHEEEEKIEEKSERKKFFGLFNRHS